MPSMSFTTLHEDRNNTAGWGVATLASWNFLFVVGESIFCVQPFCSIKYKWKQTQHVGSKCLIRQLCFYTVFSLPWSDFTFTFPALRGVCLKNNTRNLWNVENWTQGTWYLRTTLERVDTVHFEPHDQTDHLRSSHDIYRLILVRS